MAVGNSVDATTAGIQSLTSAGVWNGRTITAGTGISVANGDGTAGNPTITATGGASGAASTLDLVDDFITTQNQVGASFASQLGWFGEQAATGGVVITIGAETGRPGVISARSSNGNYLFLFLGDQGQSGMNLPILLGGGIITIQWYIKIPTISTGVHRFITRIGLGDTRGGAQANGVYFEGVDNVNSGNWQIITANASVLTTNNTSTAIDTSWHVYKIVVNAAASSVAYSIDGVEVANSPIATNIPTAALSPFVGNQKTVGNANRDVYIDLFTLNLPLTTPR